MYARIETITPEIATEYLTHNRTRGEEHENRKKRMHRINTYADDMKNGRWQLTPQGIAFYENGDLADGQHRLEAIVKAGVPVTMWVIYDVPNETTLFDRGMARSTVDVLEMGGRRGNAYSTNALSAVRYLFLLSGIQHPSEGVVMDFMIDNAENLGAAVNLARKGTRSGDGFTLTSKGCIIAAAFCALYCGITEEKLGRFFETVNSGFTNSNGEKSAIVLRNYMIQDYANNPNGKKGAFLITNNAIKDYINGVPRTKKYRFDAEPTYWSYTKKMIDTYK